MTRDRRLSIAAACAPLALVFALGVAAATLGGCSDDDTKTQDSGAGGDAAVSDTMSAPDAAPEGDGAPGDGGGSDGTSAPVVPKGKGIAVVGSDFTSMSLSLVDPATRKVTKDDCVNSGTTAPKLSLAFSGDVVVPSQPQPGNKVVLIDRKNGTLTWVDPSSCAVLKQYSVATKFTANPHDVVTTGGKLFVPRYNPNTKATSDPNDYDDGSDVLIVDESTGKVEGRIDLTSYATKAAGKVLPRPDRAVIVDGTIYVSLINVGPNYAENEIGPGRVVAIDPKQRKVTKSYDITGLYNCGGLQVTLDKPGLLLTCNGNYKKTTGQIDGSGVAWIPLSGGAVKKLAASKLGRPASFEYVAGWSSTVGYVVVPGKFSGTPADELWSFDMSAGTAKKVFTAGGGFVLGGLVVDRSGKRLYAAHGLKTKPELQLFDLTNPKSPSKGQTIDATAKSKLPPRYLGWY